MLKTLEILLLKGDNMIYNAYADEIKQNLDVQVVSCGHIFAKPDREINRPKGREDWLLFYIVSESETFYFENVEIGREGSFVIFAPEEKQHHIYQGNKTAEFYYIHFQCKQLPSDISLDTSVIYNTRLNRSVCDTFEEIIEETLNKQPCYQSVCSYKLLSLLALLKREVLHTNNPHQESSEQISRAVGHMNKSYNSNLKLEDYAQMCLMSKFHFVRTFEKIVGCTPIEYRNNIRLQHAVDLLLEEKLTVEEISSMVGYSSASYFSSAFKKKYGCSPKHYK